MNLIKHIANVLALWTIPFVFVLFFMLITGFAFTYEEAIHSGAFITLTFFYCIIVFIAYGVYNNENERDNTFKLFKTK